MLNKSEINQAFFGAGLEGDYNFLQEDLEKLANAFVIKATQKIARQERDLCLQIVRAHNPEVARVLEERRGKL